jgi:hypothetical protein
MLRQLSSISSEQRPCIWRPYALVSLILLIAFLAWDSTTWDMQLATMWGEPSGFALRDNWWLAQIMHAGARNSLGATQSFAYCRSSQFVFIGLERFVGCDFDQRHQSNQLPMGPSSVWRGGALRIALEPVGSRWRRRALLSGRSRLYRLRLHGRLLWPSTKQCAGRHQVVDLGKQRRIYFGFLTANARCTLHEPYPLDSLAVLDSRLGEPLYFLFSCAKEEKLALTLLWIF